MTTPAKTTFRTPTRTRFLRHALMHDALLISSFGLWAVVLGLSPVLAYHLLLAA